MYKNSFVCPCTQTICPTFIKCFKWHLHNTNIEYQIWSFCYNIFLSYSDDRHTYRPTDKNGIFVFRWPSKHVNPSKSLFRKFYSKEIFILYCIWVNESKSTFLIDKYSSKLPFPGEVERTTEGFHITHTSKVGIIF